MTATDYPTVKVGDIEVFDGGPADALSAISRLRASEQSAPVLLYALHVGGLLHRHCQAYVQSLEPARLVLADGVSIVVLARLLGARNIARVPTTDFGWQVINSLSSEAGGQRVRTAIVGGSAGLAGAAAKVLEASGPVEVVYATHGFHNSDDLPQVAGDIAAANPQLIIVAMGVPRETIFASMFMSAFPPRSVVMTCGGWLGFLVGHEKRAPRWMQRMGLEWTHRLAQDPRRLFARYSRGGLAVASIAVRGLGNRAIHATRRDLTRVAHAQDAQQGVCPDQCNRR